MARVHIKNSFLNRGNKLSLLMQVSGEQGITEVMSRSGMLVEAAQIISKIERSF